VEENAPFKGFVSVRCPINNQGIYRSGGGGRGGVGGWGGGRD
jgi:hypothetical protein